MSTIQNLKNFIRHGKQARVSNAHGDPTTNVSNVHATQPHRGHQGSGGEDRHICQHENYAGSEPDVYEKKPLRDEAYGDSSAAAVDNKNSAATAGGAAARAAEQAQKTELRQEVKQAARKQDVDPSVIQQIVAEERERKERLPQYPGLERWKLLEKMGDGAFSNVYRARGLEGKHGEVAIKVVRKFEMNSNQRANILKEVQIMRQLDHPNIIRLIDFHENQQYYFIILELCPGGELFHQIVRLTYFSEDLSRHVIVQVAKALEYLHEEAGVVHRDIKPENLLFYPTPFVPSTRRHPKASDEEDKVDEGEFIKNVGSGGIGIIKIADFGLSKVIWDSETMTPCGTVGYTAPEIVKDERYSKSVDMWALGCVLYTLLCGFPPFYDESIQTLTEKVARGQYTFLSPWWDEISKSAQDLVSHLLTVDPAKRYDIKQFLGHPWIRESMEETTAAEDAPPLATPLAVRQKAGTGGLAPLDQFTYLDPPGGTNRRMDFRSPGAVNLREVFDVGYAVHRQEEEGKRRKNFKQGYRGSNAVSSLNPLNGDEDDFDEDGVDDTVAESDAPDAHAMNPPAKLPKANASDVSSMEQKLRSTTLSAAAQARQREGRSTQQKGYGQHSPAVAAAARKAVAQRQKAGPFELSLDHATILKHRRAKNQAESGLREQLVVE